MEKDKATPMSEPIIIEFNTHLLFISEPALGKININFDELAKNMKHEVKEHDLSKVNYKTVIASLKGSHPQILSASLQKNEDEVFELKVKVSYEFLPEIVERIVFEKRQIAAEQSEQIAVRNMRNYLHNIKEQIANLTNVQTLTGSLQPSYGSDNLEVIVRIPHKRSVFTWGLHLVKPNSNTIKTQMHYLNSLTRQKKSTKSVPEQGIYVNHSNESSYVEMRFFAEQQEFDSVVFTLEGKFEGEYTIAIERVELIA